MYKYNCGGKLFFTEKEAIDYANFIIKISGIYYGVEKLWLKKEILE